MNLLRRLSASLVLCVMFLPSVHAGPIVFSQSAIVVDDPALTTQAFAFGSAIMTVSADPREFSRKTVGAGVDESTGVGVSGGNVTGEIDPNGAGGVSSEKISFVWDVPVIVDSLSISFLYPDGQFGDDGNEQALVTALPLVGPPILLLLLGHGQTLGLMEKEYVYPEVGDRGSPKEWLEQGSTDVLQRAHKRVGEILHEYYPSHISDAVDAELRRMLAVKLPRENMRPGNERWK